MIVTYGDSVLLTPAASVEEFDSALSDVAALIDAELKATSGLAVCANQVGAPLHLFGYKNFADPAADNLFMVNAHLTFHEPSVTWTYKEGCLSLPGMSWWIARPKFVTVSGQNLEGEKVTVMAADLKGRMFQHEGDHLKGRLILDRLSKHERKMAMRKLTKEAA